MCFLLYRIFGADRTCFKKRERWRGDRDVCKKGASCLLRVCGSFVRQDDYVGGPYAAGTAAGRQQVAADALFAQSSINVPDPGCLWKRNGCEFTTYLSVCIVGSLTRVGVPFIRFRTAFWISNGRAQKSGRLMRIDCAMLRHICLSISRRRQRSGTICLPDW